MTQFYSRNDVNYSGDVYSIPFDYIDKKEVKVYIDDELWTKWHFLNKHQLTLDEVPEDIKYSNIISVRRETDIEEKVVTYDNNSLLTKENLNKSQDQLLFAVQEIYDNNTQFQIDTDEVIETNKQEVLDIQNDFKQEIYKIVDEVKDAADKVNTLEEAVDTAVTAANTATEQADLATNQAKEAIKITTQANEDITEVLEEAENLLQETKNIADTKVDLDDMVEINLGNSFELFDTKLTDHVLTYEETKGWALQGTYVYKNALAGSRYGYPDFCNKVLEEYNQATTTETVNGVTVKVHSNGHKFYDIANKTGIDDFFNTMGSAWFYGVDTENERIFLPRDNNKIHGELIENIVDGTKWCRVYSDGWCEQGYSEIAGGTTITLLKPFKDTNYTVVATPNASAGTMTGGFCRKTSNSQVYYQPCYRTGDGQGNSTVKGSVYACGYTTVVQPYEVEKYYYICVGNTTNYEGVIEVVNQGMEILEQVNEGIESRVAKDSMQEVPCIVETYVNGTSWYRVYSDGWCEQGGKTVVSQEASNVQVVFTKPYNNIPTVMTNINALVAYTHNTGNATVSSVMGRSGAINRVSNTGFYFSYLSVSSSNGFGEAYWFACGYIA